MAGSVVIVVIVVIVVVGVELWWSGLALLAEAPTSRASDTNSGPVLAPVRLAFVVPEPAAADEVPFSAAVR